jgi:hypothetical protein
MEPKATGKFGVAEQEAWKFISVWLSDMLPWGMAACPQMPQIALLDQSVFAAKIRDLVGWLKDHPDDIQGRVVRGALLAHVARQNEVSRNVDGMKNATSQLRSDDDWSSDDEADRSQPPVVADDDDVGIDIKRPRMESRIDVDESDQHLGDAEKEQLGDLPLAEKWVTELPMEWVVANPRDEPDEPDVQDDWTATQVLSPEQSTDVGYSLMMLQMLQRMFALSDPESAQRASSVKGIVDGFSMCAVVKDIEIALLWMPVLLESRPPARYDPQGGLTRLGELLNGFAVFGEDETEYRMSAGFVKAIAPLVVMLMEQYTMPVETMISGESFGFDWASVRRDPLPDLVSHVLISKDYVDGADAYKTGTPPVWKNYSDLVRKFLGDIEVYDFDMNDAGMYARALDRRLSNLETKISRERKRDVRYRFLNELRARVDEDRKNLILDQKKFVERRVEQVRENGGTIGMTIARVRWFLVMVQIIGVLLGDLEAKFDEQFADMDRGFISAATILQNIFWKGVTWVIAGLSWYTRKFVANLRMSQEIPVGQLLRELESFSRRKWGMKEDSLSPAIDFLIKRLEMYGKNEFIDVWKGSMLRNLAVHDAVLERLRRNVLPGLYEKVRGQNGIELKDKNGQPMLRRKVERQGYVPTRDMNAPRHGGRI